MVVVVLRHNIVVLPPLRLLEYTYIIHNIEYVELLFVKSSSSSSSYHSSCVWPNCLANKFILATITYIEHLDNPKKERTQRWWNMWKYVVEYFFFLFFVRRKHYRRLVHIFVSHYSILCEVRLLFRFVSLFLPAIIVIIESSIFIRFIECNGFSISFVLWSTSS